MAKQNKRTDWGKVIFSDEMSIWLSGGRLCLWCKNDEIVVNQAGSILQNFMFRCISARATFPLKIYKENLAGILYSGYQRVLL